MVYFGASTNGQWLRDNALYVVGNYDVSIDFWQQNQDTYAVWIFDLGLYTFGGLAWAKKSANYAVDACIKFADFECTRLHNYDCIFAVGVHIFQWNFFVFHQRRRKTLATHRPQPHNALSR